MECDEQSLACDYERKPTWYLFSPLRPCFASCKPHTPFYIHPPPPIPLSTLLPKACADSTSSSSSATSLMPRDSYFLDAGNFCRLVNVDPRQGPPKPCEVITERGESIRYCCKEPECLKMACEKKKWRCHLCDMLPRENSMVCPNRECGHAACRDCLRTETTRWHISRSQSVGEHIMKPP